MASMALIFAFFVTAPTEPIAGSLTFHEVCSIIAGCAAGFSTLSILILMFRHATHLSRPNEQLKILRICLLIPVCSIIQLIGQLKPEAYFFIVPWAELMQSMALGNFFLLMLEFISPHHNQREFFFSALQVPAKRSRKRAPKNGMRWYRRKWIAIFQYPVVELLVCVATDVTNAPKLNLYCGDNNKPYFAHLWVSDLCLVCCVCRVRIGHADGFFAACRSTLLTLSLR